MHMCIAIKQRGNLNKKRLSKAKAHTYMLHIYDMKTHDGIGEETTNYHKSNNHRKYHIRIKYS